VATAPGVSPGAPERRSKYTPLASRYVSQSAAYTTIGRSRLA
jgi:hypothetical protein